MIKPIKDTTSFMGSHQGMHKTPEIYQSVAKAPVKTQPAPNVVSQVQATSQKGGFFHNLKVGFMNFAKGFNNVKNTTTGFLKGVREGLCAGVVVGTIGANLIKSKQDILKTMQDKGVDAKNLHLGKLAFNTIKGTISDTATTAWKAIKHIPDIYNKAPKDNLQLITGLPKKFVNYMREKGSDKLVVLSSVIALGVVALRTIQGKINANRANANIDHSLNEGHIPTK